jgi:hypothetical protein
VPARTAVGTSSRYPPIRRSGAARLHAARQRGSLLPTFELSYYVIRHATPIATGVALSTIMRTLDTSPCLERLFSELVAGASDPGGAFILNSGDVGLLRSLDKISAADASRSVNEGATIAAHAQHVRYGLSLMNRWAIEGGNPFSNAKWDEAWKTAAVDEREWEEIRNGLRLEAQHWLKVVGSPREASAVELTGMIASIVHLAYHLGAIRQIDKQLRGPQEGTF